MSACFSAQYQVFTWTTGAVTRDKRKEGEKVPPTFPNFIVAPATWNLLLYEPSAEKMSP